MEFEIKELKKRDYKKVIKYAIKGMHFKMYLTNKIALYLYAKYFWYLELSNATQVISLYLKDELAGVLVLDMKFEEKPYKSFFKSLYIKRFDLLQKIFFRNSAGIYEKTNKEMLDEYKKNSNPDGEIRFLVKNPDIKVKGIGTILLNELEKRESGKEIYLFTDDQCTYQFYEHRGFEKVKEKEIIMDINKKKIALKCFLYSKKL